jgi:hypothetical protein
MGGVLKLGLGLVLVLVFAAIGGCGGGDSSTVADKSNSRPYPWLEGPSREFLVPGGDNVVQTFGEEATMRERQRAFRVIAAWMKARAAQNWKKDCSYFSRAYKHGLVATDAVQVTDGKVTTCPAALAYFGPNASGNYKNNLTGPVDSLRVGEAESVGGRQVTFAYAQYHGNDGRDWVIPLEREGRQWTVAKAAPIDRMH